MTASRRLLLLFPLLAVLLLPLLGLPSASADEPPKPKDDGTEEGDDLGDKEVPFSEQVNKAIEEGVNWLLAKPDRFSDRKLQFVHYGRISAPTLYGGGTGPGYGHPAGSTALAVYTLLKCGVDPKHEVIKKGLAWLRERHTITAKWDYQSNPGSWRHTEAGGSYELSAMILALTAKYDQRKKTSASRTAKRKQKLKIKNRDDRAWLTDMVNGLIERRGMPIDGTPKEEKLGWRYNVPKFTGSNGRGTWTRGQNAKAPPHGNQDLSSTQLAALALFSAARFGIKVPVEVWEDIVAFTLKQQEKDGPEHERHIPGFVSDRYGGGKKKDRARGFAYILGSPSKTEGIATGSMTACGIANLLIAREVLAKDKKARKRWLDTGKLKKIDQCIWDGLAWLDRNWSAFSNPKRGNYHIYYLYCVERAMDILGKRLIGKHLWYPAGAKEILSRQKPKRVQVPDIKGKKKTEMQGVFWNTNATHDPKDVLDTCFALLYLKRATQGLTPPPAAITGD